MVVSASIHHVGQEGKTQSRSFPNVPHHSNGPGSPSIILLDLQEPFFFVCLLPFQYSQAFSGVLFEQSLLPQPQAWAWMFKAGGVSPWV